MLAVRYVPLNLNNVCLKEQILDNKHVTIFKTL